MSGPQRIQRKRTKGWRMPDGAVYVGRPSEWGNPFRLAPGHRHLLQDTRFDNGPEWDCADGEERGVAVRLFREYFMDGRLDVDPDRAVEELFGRDLACWCPLDQPCHADVLLEIANGGAS